MPIEGTSSGSWPTPGRDRDLLLGRLAVRKRALTGAQLVEGLLVQSVGGARKTLRDVLVERGLAKAPELTALERQIDQGRTPEEDEPYEAPAPDEPDPRIGKVVAGVRLDTRLETTELWTTYAGRRAGDPEPVTLSFVVEDALRRGLWLDFLETVRTCQSLSSPHVAPVLGVSRVEGGFALVSRFRDGFSLATLLTKVRRVRLGEALRIAKEAARGLADLHAKGLLHRSIEPRTIWLPKKGTIWVRDVGLAAEPRGAQRLAERGSLLGSPWHLAPEVLAGQPPDVRTDTYALGVVLYEMITGVRPFEGLGLLDLASQHAKAPVIPPEKFFPEVPLAVSVLLQGMLAKKKDERPKDQALVASLEKLEAEAPPPRASQRLEKPPGSP